MANKQLLQSAGDGTAVPAGYVGEAKQSLTTTLMNAAATGVFKELTSIELTPGVWILSGSASCYGNYTTFTDDAEAAISTTSASSSGASFGFNWLGLRNPFSTGNAPITFPSYTVTVTATQRYYLNVRNFYSAGTPQWRGSIVATRIA